MGGCNIGRDIRKGGGEEGQNLSSVIEEYMGSGKAH